MDFSALLRSIYSKLSGAARAFGLIGQLSSVKSWIVDPQVGLVGLSITFGSNPAQSHMGHGRGGGAGVGGGRRTPSDLVGRLKLTFCQDGPGEGGASSQKLVQQLS